MFAIRSSVPFPAFLGSTLNSGTLTRPRRSGNEAAGSGLRPALSCCLLRFLECMSVMHTPAPRTCPLAHTHTHARQISSFRQILAADYAVNMPPGLLKTLPALTNLTIICAPAANMSITDPNFLQGAERCALERKIVGCSRVRCGLTARGTELGCLRCWRPLLFAC